MVHLPKRELYMAQINLPYLAVSPEQAAKMTGHSRTAIYYSISIGELASFKSGKRRLILTSEIERWIVVKSKAKC